MNKKYHISQDGNARKCQAQTPESCKATKRGIPQHFETREEAQNYYERKMSKNQLNTVKASDKEIENKLLSKYNDELSASAEDRLEHFYKKLEIQKQYKESIAKYNSMDIDDFEQRLAKNKVSAGELREINDNLAIVCKTTKALDVSLQNGIPTFSTYARFLADELNVLQKSVQEYSKKGKLLSALSSDFKKNKNVRIDEMYDRMLTVRNTLNEVRRENEDLVHEQNKILENELLQKGYRLVWDYRGHSKSSHHDGPNFDYQCPECHAEYSKRVQTLPLVRGYGYCDVCRICDSKIVIPVLPKRS